MAERLGPAVFNIPPHRAFADALVAGLLDQHGGDPLSLAHGAILLPNSRAVLAVRDAFVRQAERGLLLPRLIPIGDEDIDTRLGAALEPLDSNPVLPAIDPLHRQLILAQLIQTERATERNAVDAAEAMRLAADLARTLDQLIVEGVSPQALQALEIVGALQDHWQTSLNLMAVVLDRWPEELAQRGLIDLTDRRNRLLLGLAARWAQSPPTGFVVAAGISTGAPAVAELLRVIVQMPGGQVVLGGLDQQMAEEEWNEIGSKEGCRPIETHPQFHLALLLSRMKVARGEVRLWRRSGRHDAPSQRSRALSLAMQPPAYTLLWHKVPARDLRLGRVAALECETPGHEAQVIALAMRAALEVPGQTAALVTPDRDLARRVVALLARWDILADDSAGQPLSATPNGGLILALATAVSSDFAPVALLSLLKHPLVMAGEGRLAWLDGVRALDLALRGPRPSSGLTGITAFLGSGQLHERDARAKVAEWWCAVVPLLAPVASIFTESCLGLPTALIVLREALQALCGDVIWAGAAGHAAAKVFEQLEALGGDGPGDLTRNSFSALLRDVMAEIAVRPSGALHPRLFIWGLLEAKLQTADVMILGGLNEGVWPALPAPDPWLAPAIRLKLGLPTLERRIGLAAHDMVGAMGARDVLLTRAKRDASAPAIPSRFWLRLQAFTGGLPVPDVAYDALAHAIDQPPHPPNLTKRPAPKVDAAHRPKTINVTDVDALGADPFAFYAKAILKLRALDPVDAEPSAAWRGSLIHGALEDWAKQDNYHPDRIITRFEARFAAAALHPLLTTLWLPRFRQAAAWIAQQVSDARAVGRAPLAAELKGQLLLGGITLKARLDRVDQMAQGALAILDYKTGDPPKAAQIAAGYARQLGLIGLMADRGAFAGLSGAPAQFEYWSLARDPKTKVYGYRVSALAKDEQPDAFLVAAERGFLGVAHKWLTGDAPFTAKLVPEYAYAEYDHLMRYDEWAGRDE